MKKALTIAGSDCSGGAGIQADLKTFSAHGVYGMSVIVSVVAENTVRVIDVKDISPRMIQQQIDAVFEDIIPDSVKIGMLSNAKAMEAVADKLHEYRPNNIVIDPVMYAKNGYPLMAEDATDALISQILPFADVLTPNLLEAERIAKMGIETVYDMEQAAKVIYQFGVKYPLIKGGHLEGDAVDVLYDGQGFTHLVSERIETKNTHGTGCTYSSAIASNLALGFDVKEAVRRGKEYITEAIRWSKDIGQGHGPVNHFYQFERTSERVR